MSTSVSILGAAVVFAAAQLLLRKDSPSYAFLLSIGAAVFILLRLGTAAQDLMRGVWALSRRVDGTAFSCLLRCAGILLITDYARTLCEEAGADSLAWCTGLAGRLLVLAAAFPLLEEICQRIWGACCMKLFQKGVRCCACRLRSFVCGPGCAGGRAARSARAGALAALSECCAAGCGFIHPRSGRSAAFPFAGFSAGNDPADGALLCRCPAVPAAFGPAFFSGRRSGRQCAFGTGSGCRVRHPFMGRPDDPRAAGVRADDRMERLPSGVPSGLQRCAHRRRGSKCQCSGKRSAVDRAVFSGTVHGA